MENELETFVFERLELFPLERYIWSHLRIWKSLFVERGPVCLHEKPLKNKRRIPSFFFPEKSSHHYVRSFPIAFLCHVTLIPLSPLWQGKQHIINLQIRKVDVTSIQKRRSLTAEGIVWAWPDADRTSPAEQESLLKHHPPSTSVGTLRFQAELVSLCVPLCAYTFSGSQFAASQKRECL